MKDFETAPSWMASGMTTNMMLISGMVGLAHAPGLKMIADLLSRQRGIGCGLVQGYFVSKPARANASATPPGL